MERGEIGIEKNTPAWRAAENLNQINCDINPIDRTLYNMLDQEMFKIGYYLIGAGEAANVYEHRDRPKEVLKIFYNKYLQHADWLRWVAQNQHNPHVPQLHSDLVCVKHNVYAIRMERLEPLTASTIKKYLNPKLIKDKDVRPEVLLEYYYYLAVNKMKQNRKWLVKNYPLLVATMDEAAQLRDDLYVEAMQRGSTVVFIDP